jgi:hypothetical protein
MSDNCFKKNELFIPGTRYDERMQGALNPSYVSVDERSVADIMVFIATYASLIRYYTLQGESQENYIAEGDWKSLIMSDEAFNYAGISVARSSLPNISFYKYNDLYETGSTTAKRNAAYRALWDVLFSLYKSIDTFFISLPAYMPLRSVLHTEIRNNLVPDLRQAATAYLNANAIGNIPGVLLHTPTPSTEDEFKFSFAKDLIHGAFDSAWIDDTAYPDIIKWQVYIAKLKTELAASKDFFNTKLTNEQDKVDYSTVQLKQMFKRAFEAYSRIITVAKEHLQVSLDDNSAHFAHHGLLLAFVKMFGVLQQDANEFTKKHLEYYYNRVLNIKPAVATPDSAHIVFEAAKNVSAHLVKAATMLNGGKDGIGKMLVYKTDNDVTVGQSKIAQLKTVFLEPAGSAGQVKRVYAAPVADSSDGDGAPFTGTDTSWTGFGNKLKDASVGFYIASPVLHLTEGVRIVDFQFTTDAEGIATASLLNGNMIATHLKIFYSGAKQWEEALINEGGVTENCTLAYSYNTANRTFTIRLTLPLHYQPVVGYDASVCDGGLDTNYPVFRFVLDQGEDADLAFHKLNDISITKISLTTSVSEISNLSLANELGVLASSKPAQLFGPVPKIGSPFYIGHTELQHKMLTSVSLKMKWLNHMDLVPYYAYKEATVNKNYIGIVNNTDFKVKVDLLRNKTWKPLSATTTLIDSDETTDIVQQVSGLSKALDRPDSYTTEAPTFATQSQNGFLRLVLKSPVLAFGHTVWPKLFAQQTVAYTSSAAKNTIPNQPFVPVLESIQLTYVASQDIHLGSAYKKEQGGFFHMMPFGIKEKESDAKLLPDLEVGNIQLESAFYIGISDTTATQNVSLLLQLNEGTEDISVDPPAISWFYLSVAGWQSMDRYLVADATGSLLKSGIITFTVPNDLDPNSVELPAGHSWIAAVVAEGSAGLPKLVAVYTNAVKASFWNNDNDPEHLSAALPAGKISKFFGADAAIKKINQPFASFGGKKAEEGDSFYSRISERLRHKNRAVTIWDYDRLILDEFPDVYMAKCLNHTGYQVDCSLPVNDEQRVKYKENVAGHVMLVTVPFITNLRSGNIYQPTLSASKLADIKNFLHGYDNAGTCNDYIKALHCGHVALHVENPQYETIEVICSVKVKDCLDALAYKSQLGSDLHKFLAPWIDGDVAAIKFGGKLHASQVVYFIEQLDYIDYLEELKIVQRDKNGQVNIGNETLAVATTSRSVLTSIGDDENDIPKHSITLI